MVRRSPIEFSRLRGVITVSGSAVVINDTKFVRVMFLDLCDQSIGLYSSNMSFIRNDKYVNERMLMQLT